MKVSVIIPTYNRCNIILKTINSLINQDYPKDNFEIIIVDNNSSDETEKIILDYINKNNGILNLRYVKEMRQGDVYARNSGAAQAKGEYLFFTDDDALFDANWISCVVQILDDYPKVAMVGTRIEILWDKQPNAWVKNYEYLLGKISRGDSGYIISSKGFCIPNGSLAIRKKVFYEVGGNNPGQIGEWLVGNAEVGLYYKVHALGYPIAFTDDTTMWHMQFKDKNGTYEDIIRRIENCAISDAYTDVIEKNMFRVKNLKLHQRKILKNLFLCKRTRLRSAYFQYRADKKYNEFIKKYSDNAFVESIRISDCVLNDQYQIPPILYQTSYNPC